MSPFAYVLIWLLYLLAVVLSFVGAWRVSRAWPYPLKTLGRIALAVIFLTPAPQIAGGTGLAPAFISMVFDQMQGADGGWFRAGLYLVIAATLGVFIYLALMIRWWIATRRKSMNRD